MKSASMVSIATAATLALAALPAQADNAYLKAADASGASAFLYGTNWTTAGVPSSANDYFTASSLLRTPPTDTDAIFTGRSLTLQSPSGSSLLEKSSAGAGAGRALIINNFTNEAGALVRSGGNSGSIMTITGNVWAISGSSSLLADQTTWIIKSPLVGPEGVCFTNRVSNTSGGGFYHHITYSNDNSAYKGKLVLSATGPGDNYAVFFGTPASAPGNPSVLTPDQIILGANAIFRDQVGLSLGANSGVTLAANATVWCEGLRSNTIIAGPITDNGGGYNLTKRGAGVLTLAGNNSFGGGLVLWGLTAGSGLNLNNSTALGTGTFTITSGNNATLDNTSGGALSLVYNNPQTWNNGFAFLGSSSLDMGSGLVTINGNVTVTVASHTLTVGGIADKGAGFGLTKRGPGTLALNPPNDVGGFYSGPTTVAEGTLVLQGAGSALAGSSSITVASNATLAVGASEAPQMLTMHGNLLLKSGSTCVLSYAKSSNVTSDCLVGLASVSYGGNLVLNNMGTNALAAGDALVLFSANAGSYRGGFATITPATPGPGLFWNTTLLAADGTLRVGGCVHHVAVTGTDPVPPFNSWATAATNIQDAIDVAGPGDDILVTNGVYQTGAREVYGMSNRVALTKAVSLRSVNGPAVTSIVGTGPNGPAAVRCVYLVNGAGLAGFTLTNGATQISGDYSTNQSGGGIWCESRNAVVSHCVLTGNSASQGGGGAYSGTLNNCTLSDNSAHDGGGAFEAALNNCTLSGNSAVYYGGGAFHATLNNCTVSGNSAAYYGGGGGGGTFDSSLRNCIVYYNTAPSGPNHFFSLGEDLRYCCTTPLPEGPGNIDSEPGFVNTDGWANLRLQPSSPCINAGNNACAPGLTDLDGNPRISGGTVDVGAYEFQPWHYVSLASANPVPPFNSWATAATNIQDALDMAGPGDDILVTNGVYQTGARAVYLLNNRVAVTNAVRLRSVNGPAVTSIVGTGPNEWTAVRCVYLADGAVLTGFTLTNGATHAYNMGIDYDLSGGGVWCESRNAVVSNCVLTGNSAEYYGGGAYSGTLNNCTLTGNSAEQYGGGACSGGTLNNCTLTGNSADSGGGASDSTLNNCTLTGNSAGFYGGGAYLGMLNNCTLTGNSALYRGGGAYLGTLSNCTLTGNSAGFYGGGAFFGTLNNCTLTGNSAGNAVGGASYATLNNCIIYYNTATSYPNYYCDANGGSLNYCCTTPLADGPGNFSSEPRFVNTNGWANLRLQAGSPCINAGNNAYAPALTDLDGNPRIFGGTVDVGAYEFQPWHYVSLASANPVPPFNSWATAARTIQDAIDVAFEGDEIQVTNGVYQTGAREVYGMSNRVAVTKAVSLRSVNGPAVTCIVGSGPLGDTAVRCVYLTNGAVLAGFTLTNGATQMGFDIPTASGGGVYCQSVSALVSNCVLSGNSAFFGGGAYSGTLDYCALRDNSGVQLGGGAHSSTINNCTLTGNSTDGYHGGGAYSCTLNNCTVAGNRAHRNGGGAYDGTLNNCIVYYNTAGYGGGNCSGDVSLNYCSTTPLPAGPGNIDSEPRFVNTNGWANLRLQAGSSCINAGNNAYAPGLTDLDGNPRVFDGTVDIGAYEFQLPNITPSYVLGVGTLGNGSIQLAFTNTPGAGFSVLGATNVALPSSDWTVLGPAVEGPAGYYQFTDPAPLTNRQRFYRVRSP